MKNYPGVSYFSYDYKSRRNGKIHTNGYYKARIMINYKSIILGHFKTKEKAAAAYQFAKKNIHTRQPTRKNTNDINYFKNLE